MTKKEIRSLMLLERNLRDPIELNLKNQKIIKDIKNDPLFMKASCVSIFYPMKGEINLLSLIHEKKTFCFPKIESTGMRFYKYQPLQEFAPSKFGVMEPISGDICDLEIDYMLVPALAISKDNYRIGYGKGYYDQFLSKHRPEHVFGVIYDFQEFDELPHEPYDQKLDGYFKGTL